MLRDDIPCLKHCECSMGIARFYLLELEYSRRKKNEPHWNGQHEDYYLSEITEEVTSILRFVLSACVGEARHAYRHAFQEKGNNKIIANLFTKQIFGQLGWGFVPRNRISVYRTFIPEGAFWRMFKLTHDAFDIPTWHSDFGGKKWKKAVVLAMKAYKAVCIGDLQKIIIWTDTLINCLHNGGFLLNKFDCGSHRIDKLLSYKKSYGTDGIDFLKKIADKIPNCVNCHAMLPLAPTESQ